MTVVVVTVDGVPVLVPSTAWVNGTTAITVVWK